MRSTREKEQLNSIDMPFDSLGWDISHL